VRLAHRLVSEYLAQRAQRKEIDLRPLRLGACAGDNPISSFAPFAFFAVNFSGSEFSVAALPR